MKADPARKSGFYWVRFEGEVQVAEYVARSRNISILPKCGCPLWAAHWHILNSHGIRFYRDSEVCELLSERLTPPLYRNTAITTTGDQ